MSLYITQQTTRFVIMINNYTWFSFATPTDAIWMERVTLLFLDCFILTPCVKYSTNYLNSRLIY